MNYLRGWLLSLGWATTGTVLHHLFWLKSVNCPICCPPEGVASESVGMAIASAPAASISCAASASCCGVETPAPRRTSAITSTRPCCARTSCTGRKTRRRQESQYVAEQGGHMVFLSMAVCPSAPPPPAAAGWTRRRRAAPPRSRAPAHAAPAHPASNPSGHSYMF